MLFSTLGPGCTSIPNANLNWILEQRFFFSIDRKHVLHTADILIFKQWLLYIECNKV